MIPHGTAATARLEIDFPQDRGAIVPLGFRGPCACATWRFVAIGKDGRERVSYGQPTAEHAVLPGDRLLLELTIDTRQKEAAQQQVLTNSGEALLVDLENRHGRMAVPVVFTFGIEAQVVVTPHAHVDFGALPLSRTFSTRLQLRGKDDRAVAFGTPRVEDARVHAALRTEEGGCELEVRVVPDRALGPGVVHATITVPTDLPSGYELPIPVTGQIVSDIEIKPMERISFGRLDLREPREGFVIVRDHDLDRPAEFVVLGIATILGKDLDRHVEAVLEPVQGDERAARLVLRYLGTLRGEQAFRGRVDLGKRGLTGSVASVEFVGFGHE